MRDHVGQTMESERDVPWKGWVQGHFRPLPLCGSKKEQGVQGDLVGGGHFLCAPGLPVKAEKLQMQCPWLLHLLLGPIQGCQGAMAAAGASLPGKI